MAGCKQNRFYSIYQPRRHFNQPPKLFVLLLFKFLIKHHLPVGQVKNRIHQPDSKIHQPRVIGHYFLYTLRMDFSLRIMLCSKMHVILFAPIPLATMLFNFIIFYTKHKRHKSSASYLQSQDYHKSSIIPPDPLPSQGPILFMSEGARGSLIRRTGYLRGTRGLCN